MFLGRKESFSFSQRVQWKDKEKINKRRRHAASKQANEWNEEVKKEEKKKFIILFSESFFSPKRV